MSENANPVVVEERADKRRDPKPTKRQLEAALREVLDLLKTAREHAEKHQREAQERHHDGGYIEKAAALDWYVGQALTEIGKVLS